ncbi:TonB family protein [Paraburkholderia fungorum]|uniref:TonB family protein n=1 Tax=Paraburkholderia fungorum TaxID=134537 RepID=UPI000945BC82
MRSVLTTVVSLLTLVGCAQPRHSETSIECKFSPPEYPALSRRNRETGTVDVRAMTDSDGKITGVALERSSGYQRLDAAALAAMRASTCEPLYRNGTRAPFSLTQTFHFNLTD